MQSWPCWAAVQTNKEDEASHGEEIEVIEVGVSEPDIPKELAPKSGNLPTLAAPRWSELYNELDAFISTDLKSVMVIKVFYLSLAFSDGLRLSDNSW